MIYELPQIILIDDDESSLRLLSQYLVDGPYVIKRFSSAKKAINYLLSNEMSRDVHAIVCDYEMPDLNGDQLLEIFRASGKHFDIPFFFISAHELGKIQPQVDGLKFNGFIPKPFSKSSIWKNLIDKID